MSQVRNAVATAVVKVTENRLWPLVITASVLILGRLVVLIDLILRAFITGDIEGESMDFITSVAAGIVATATAAAIAWFYRFALEKTRKENRELKTEILKSEGMLESEKDLRQKYQNAFESAHLKYTKHLDSLINSSSETVIKARSIVATRNDLRGSLESVNKLLNSEIDELGTLIKKGAGESELRVVIEILKNKWPSKKDQIEISLRKLLAELGIEKIDR